VQRWQPATRWGDDAAVRDGACDACRVDRGGGDERTARAVDQVAANQSGDDYAGIIVTLCVMPVVVIVPVLLVTLPNACRAGDVDQATVVVDGCRQCRRRP